MRYEEKSLLALSRSESVELISRSQVGRVVFTERALPAVAPVTFALNGDDIVMDSTGDSRLVAAAARGGVFAFEVDNIDPAARTGWSVVVLGEPELVVGLGGERLDLTLEPLVGRPDVCIRLPLTVVTGRRIARSGDTPTAPES